MQTRTVSAVLIALLLIFQAQIWFGRGSLPSVARLGEQLRGQTSKNQQALLSNERLSAEVRDLKEGLDMVEDRARSELGMVKPNEIFVQVNK